MQRVIICFLFMVLYAPENYCFGQGALNIDSLTNQLNTQKNDTARIRILYLLSMEFSKSDPEQALIYSKELYALSRKNNNISGIIDAHSLKCRSYIALGQYDSAIINCESAIYLSDSIKDQKRLADGFSNYGHILFFTEGPARGYEYYFKSYLIYNKIGDSLGLVNALNGIGVMFMSQAIYDSAIFYYMKLIRISEKMGFETMLGKGYNNLGVAYDELNNYKNARYYLLESIKINKKLNNLIIVGKAYNNLGNITYEKKEYDTAWILYSNALEFSKKTNYILGVADANIGLGNISEKRDEYQNAYEYYQLAKSSYGYLGHVEGFLIAYKNQASIYEKWGNYNKSIEIYDTCLLIAKEYGLTERKEQLYSNMYKTYWLKKDFENAFEYLLEYSTLRDTIFNLEKAKTIGDLQMKYEKEKDQAQILALEKENLEKDLNLRVRTNQRNIYLFAGSGTISIILFLLIFYRHKARKDRIISEQKIQQLEEEKKLLAARSIVDGQEDERKRIAKELHDGLGVLLSTAKMQFTSIKDKSPENKPLIDKATKLLGTGSR